LFLILIESVYTERRGIFTNPPKKGEVTTPGILFSYFKSNYKKGEYQKPVIPNRCRSADKKEDRFAFKPASLLLDAPFQPDKDVYGEDKKIIEEMMNNSLDV
jgi:hypothetical protein